MSDYRIPQDALKDPAESLQVELNLFEMCARFWKPNELYSLGEVVRPRTPNGYAFSVTVGGTSGAEEPSWRRGVGELTPEDGAVTWTGLDAASNGVNPITSPSAVSDPSGLNILNVSVIEDVKIVATYQGGTAGKRYDSVFSFTLNGVTRVVRQRVHVRKR